MLVASFCTLEGGGHNTISSRWIKSVALPPLKLGCPWLAHRNLESHASKHTDDNREDGRTKPGRKLKNKKRPFA